MATQLNLGPTQIQSARVLDVNVTDYTVVVSSQFFKKPLVGIPFMVPYTHHYSGEGMYFMPEVGSVCWICTPSDGNKPFVLGWGIASEDGAYRGRRQDLNPGDIFLGTRDDNFMILRRGGVVQIGAGPLSQRIFLPVNNIIKDLCENYSLQTLGGELDWTIAREETTTDGNRPALLKLRAKQFANDQAYVSELQIGSHDGDDSLILSLIVNASGAQGAAKKFSLGIEKNGSVTWKSEQNVLWEVKGTYKIKAQSNVEVESQASVSLKATSNFSAEGSLSKMEAKSGPATVRSPAQVVLDAPVVFAGGAVATQPVALAIPLMTWLAAHVHNIIVPTPGSPTTPCPVPPPPLMVSQALLAAK